jgi:hypothetical protein
MYTYGEGFAAEFYFIFMAVAEDSLSAFSLIINAALMRPSGSFVSFLRPKGVLSPR